MIARSEERGRMFAAAVAVLLALLGAACSKDEPNDRAAASDAVDLQEVTVVLDWTPNTNHAGIYMAEAEGWYADAGLDVEIIQPGENGSLQALGSGQADFAVSVAEEIVPARAEGLPVVSIAAILAHNTSSLMALTSSGIEGPADLAGHRYGGYGGPLERALIEALVTCAGGDPAQVEFVEVGNVDYRVGLERGDYDFVWIFEGWDAIRLRELEDVDITTLPFFDQTDCIPDWYTPLIATSEELIESDPELVEAFLEATSRGYEVAIDDPAAAAEALLEAAPELDEALVEASAAYLADQYADEGLGWGGQDPAVWARFSAFLLEAGLVEEEIDVNTAFTNVFLP